MTRLDRIVSLVALAPIAPVIGLLVGWWGSFALLGDSPLIGPAALTGLLAGIAVDVVLRRRLGSLLSLPTPALLAIAMFYSVCIYGFLMGLPVGNLVVGLAGGYVAGRRSVLLADSPRRRRDRARLAAGVATAILAVLCTATALMALHEPTIGSQVQHMLGLPFVVTDAMIDAIIVFGGATLLAGEYAVTLAAARFAAGRSA